MSVTKSKKWQSPKLINLMVDLCRLLLAGLVTRCFGKSENPQNDGICMDSGEVPPRRVPSAATEHPSRKTCGGFWTANFVLGGCSIWPWAIGLGLMDPCAQPQPLQWAGNGRFGSVRFGSSSSRFRFRRFGSNGKYSKIKKNAKIENSKF